MEENKEPEILLRRVGVVRSKIKEPSFAVRSQDVGNLEEWHITDQEWQKILEKIKEEQEAISELVINEDLNGILDGIEEYSHILVLFWAHVPPEGRSITRGYPMGRKEFPKVGIFATNSPVRPNPICVTVVPLLERKGRVLKVKGLDAIDDTPILDIKPYYPGYYAVSEEVKLPGWVKQMEREFAEGSLE